MEPGQDGALDRALAWLGLWRERPVLAWLLVVINLGGVAYGFLYYGPQFALTPAWLWPWVPDSPLSTGFFAAALAARQVGRPSQLLEWLAFIANLKVGLWTGFVLLHYDAYFGIFHDALSNLNFWLFWLHLAMALQAFVLARSLRLGWWSWVATAWFGIDIAMDYALAPVRYATQPGCVGTKPITVPCADVPLLVSITVLLWVLGAGLAFALARRSEGRPQET